MKLLSIIIKLFCSLYITYSTLHPGDRIADSIFLDNSFADPDGLNTKIMYIKALPTLNRFAALFPWSNGRPHYTYTRNGQLQFSSIQYSTGPQFITNNELLVAPDRVTMVYSLQTWDGYRQLNITDGTFVTFPNTFFCCNANDYDRMNVVNLAAANNFAVCMDDRTAGNTNIRCIVVDQSTNTFTNLGIINTGNLAEQQSIWDIKQINNNKYIMLTESNGPEAPSLANNGTLLYYLDMSNNTSTWVGTAMNVIPNTTNYKFPTVEPTSDGGWVVLAVDTDNDEIFCLKFDTANTLQHHKRIHGTGKTVDFAIHDDIAYTVITSTEPATLNQLVGVEVNTLDCEISAAVQLVSTREIHNHPSIDINTDNDVTVAGILFKARLPNNTYQAQYSEYLINLGPLAPGCAEPRCTGCYGSYTCPMCVGSTTEAQEARRRGPDDCTCKDGYWDNFPTDQDCIQCPYNCGTCSDSSGDCDSCPAGSNRITDPDCLCPTQRYWDDGVSADCQDCPTGCLECNNNTECTICDTGYFMNTTSSLCDPCQHPCTECENNALNCTSCVAGTNRLGTVDQCACEPRFYDNGSICDDCPSNCLQCLNNSTCQVCEDGRFVNGTGLCEPCQHPCTKCNTTALDCTECVIGLHRGSHTEQCACSDGYYDDGSICKQCDRKCGTCQQNNGNICVIPCQSNCGFCGIDGKCMACQMGYYLNSNKECVDQCHSKCVACQGQADKCLLCYKGIGRSQNDNENCKCLDGYYEVGLKDCKPCKIQRCRLCDSDGTCIECENKNLDPRNCINLQTLNQQVTLPYTQDPNGSIQCKKGQNRMEDYPCQCNHGFYSVMHSSGSYDCEKCPQECTRCINENYCTQCIENRVLDEFTGVCECKIGFKEDKNNNCKQCFTYQGKCFFECPDTTKKSKEQLTCIDQNYFKISNLVLIYSSWGIAFLLSLLLILSVNKQWKKYTIKVKSHLNLNKRIIGTKSDEKLSN